MIPCSDQFGVDICVDNYADVLEKASQKSIADTESNASPTKVFSEISANQQDLAPMNDDYRRPDDLSDSDYTPSSKPLMKSIRENKIKAREDELKRRER